MRFADMESMPRGGDKGGQTKHVALKSRTFGDRKAMSQKPNDLFPSSPTPPTPRSQHG